MDLIVWRQIWTVSGILINIIGLGFMLGYPNCVIPALKDANSEIKADTSDVSWIASCIGLSGMVGFVITSYFMDRFGRRFCHAIMILPGIFGWYTIYFSKSISAIIIGRLLNGLTSGGTVLLGAIIIGEYSSPEYRGTFLNLKTSATCVGIILSHVLGHYLHWRTVAIIGSIPCTIAFLITCTWPESTPWLIMKNRFDDSEKAFFWIRGKNKKSIEELKSMHQAQIENVKLTDEVNFGCCDKFKNFLKVFTKKDFLKPVIISTTAFILLEACGRHTFPTYALDFIKGFDKNESHNFYYTLGIDIITTVTTLIAAVIVKVFKRRTLLFASGISSIIILVTICLYLYMVSKDIVSSDRSWIPLLLFALYFVLSNLGCTPIPLALLGEIFPVAYKSIASSVCGIVTSLILMITLKITPFLIEKLDVYGTFLIFAGFMVLALVHLYFALPETKNRTLQEIEDYFKHGAFEERRFKTIEMCDLKEKMLKIKENI